MHRTSSRLLGALAIGTSALTLSGCAVIGGASGITQVGQDNPLHESFNLIQPGVLTVCSDIPYPPFEFEQDGELTGYDIELVREIADELDLDINVIDSSFEAIESGASLTSCDLNTSSISITEPRQRVMAFTIPYFNDDLVLMARSGSDVTDMDSARSARVGVQAATTGEAFARENGITPVQFEDGGMQVQALQAGNVDAVLGNQSVLGYQLKDNPEYVIVEEFATGEQLGMAVAAENGQLNSAISRALLALRTDGTLAQLQETWFGAAQEDYQ